MSYKNRKAMYDDLKAAGKTIPDVLITEFGESASVPRTLSTPSPKKKTKKDFGDVDNG